MKELWGFTITDEQYDAIMSGKFTMSHCEQCGILMNPVQAVIGPVCLTCCKKNHKKVANGR